MRRNLLPLAMAALIVAASIAAGLLVLNVADSEDALREAEVEYAELEALAPALGDLPATAARAPAGKAVRAARRAEELWPGDRSATIAARTGRLAQQGLEATALAAAAEPPSIALRSRLRGGERKLVAEINSARAFLRKEANHQGEEAAGAVLLIMGLAGMVLAALAFALFAARRRRIVGAAEQQVARRSEERLDALLRQGSDMIAVVAPDTTILYGAGPVRSLLGYETDELTGTKLARLVYEEDVSELLAICAEGGGGAVPRELRFRHRDGSLRICETRATSLLDDERWNGIALNVWDVSDRKALEGRLLHQAFHDDLTGLANRALFVDRLENTLAQAARVGRTVAVFLVDLDDFKSINDSFGHSIGDALLQRVSRALLVDLADVDTIARLSGDEFAVLVEDSRSRHADETVARRILAAIEKPFEIEGRSFPVSASVGIGRAEPGEFNADQLVRNADLAMYTAKGNRKSGWTHYRDDMFLSVEDRLQLKADLAAAAPKFDDFELHYQPVVELESGRIVAFEALLRWAHPVRGLLSPDVFICLAEESGEIVPLGRWVLRRACEQLRRWADAYGLRAIVSINVSARQLAAPGFAGDVRRALREHGVKGQQLVLELTESELVRNHEEAAEVFRQVKEMGVSIAIDDFGTGYSSLSQLQVLPVDLLKMDRGLAISSNDAEARSRLIQGVTEIAAALRLRIIAEGIEDADQLAALRALDVPYGQGFLFGRPLPAAVATDLVRLGEVAEAPLSAVNDRSPLTNGLPVVKPPAR